MTKQFAASKAPGAHIRINTYLQPLGQEVGGIGHGRSLLVGATGQVGQQLLRSIGLERCIPSARHPTTEGWLKLDLASINQDAAHRLLDPLDLNAIYCVGGMTNVELCESEQDTAMRINCEGPAILAALAHERKLSFVYFSTEYVFDGVDGPYVEDSAANPRSVYGASKWRGEQRVREACPQALIVRTTVVYGHDAQKKNFLYGLRRALLAGEAFRVPTDQISTPTYNSDLAVATLRLVKIGASGCYHLCGPELLSRADFATQAANLWGLDSSLIVGVPTTALGQRAPRPLNAGLLTEKLRRLHPEIPMRTLAESLAHWDSQGVP